MNYNSLVKMCLKKSESIKSEDEYVVISPEQLVGISSEDVSQYSTANSWIIMNGTYNCLIKNLFSDIHPENINPELIQISKYNNVLLPFLAAEKFGIESVCYYLVKLPKIDGTEINPGDTYLMTFDEKRRGEEVIEGVDILTDEKQLTEFFSERLSSVRNFLKLRKVPEHTIKKVEDELIRQEIFKKFVEYTDNHNRNWSIAVDGKNVRPFPTYDYDLCCGVNYLDSILGKKIETKIESCDDNGETDLESFIMQYRNLPWMQTYLREILANLDIEEIFEESYRITGISIPEEAKTYYREYFKTRYQELNDAYQKIFVIKEPEEEHR